MVDADLAARAARARCRRAQLLVEERPAVLWLHSSEQKTDEANGSRASKNRLYNKGGQHEYQLEHE
jgi:hypothetical protein